jgi:hypothetical protein
VGWRGRSEESDYLEGDGDLNVGCGRGGCDLYEPCCGCSIWNTHASRFYDPSTQQLGFLSELKAENPTSSSPMTADN